MNKKLLLIYLILGLNLYFAQNNWQLINPQPTNRPGIDIHFLDDQHGFILTNNDLLETYDFGGKWSINSKIENAIDMDFFESNGVILSTYSYTTGNLRITQNGGESWIKINTLPLDTYRSIKIFDDKTIYITSSSKLYKSIDLGTSWEILPIPHNQILKSVFINKSVGYFCTTNGKIAKTIDGGLSWILQYNLSNSIPNNFISIYFYNENIGFAFRDHNSLFRTTDGGATWIEKTNIPYDMKAFQFLDENTGYAAGDNMISKTSDGGQTWQPTGYYDTSYGSPYYLGLYFRNPSEGIICGLRGMILKTSDAANNWQAYSPFYDPIFNVDIYGNTGYTNTRYKLYKTTDKANNWSEINLQNTAIRNMQFFDANNGILLSEKPNSTTNTTLYKTIDGGQNWTILYDKNYPGMNSIIFINEMRGFAYIDNVGVNITTDGGKTFQSIGSTVNYRDYNFINENIGYALVGFYGSKIIKTINAGLTWNTVYENLDIDAIDIQFLNENTGYLVSDDYSSIYKTSNGGLTWTKMSSTPQEYLSSIFFYDENKGYLVDDDGNVYYTVNGGTTWNFSSFFLTSYPYHPKLKREGNDIILYGDNGVIAKINSEQLETENFPINNKYKIKLFPNPTSDFVNINLDKSLTINKIEVYDFTGRVLEQKRTTESVFNTQNLKAGNYIIKVYTDQNEVFSTKLIIK